MSERIDLNYVVGAIERLKAWAIAERERAKNMRESLMMENKMTTKEQIEYEARSVVLEQVIIRLDTMRMVIEEVAKDE